MTHQAEELARAHRSDLLREARSARRSRATGRSRADRNAAEAARRAREAVVRDL